VKASELAMRLDKYEREWTRDQGLYWYFAQRLIDDGFVCGDNRDDLLAAVHAIDVKSGYRVPFDTDHVHKVERDEPTGVPI